VIGQDAQKGYRTQAEKLQLSDRVQFFSPVHDVRAFYAAADLLAAPSLEDSFNLPVLEAMSCGLPVVVSPHAGVSEWLTNAQDSIVLNDPENVEELSDAIRMLAQDSALRQTIAANALQTAKRFSWDAHTSDLRKLLVQAAEEKPRHCSQKKN
jgi:UDP-glucose:(heptosyl)LPS alpha-1,3-glucosyltransferase